MDPKFQLSEHFSGISGRQYTSLGLAGVRLCHAYNRTIQDPKRPPQRECCLEPPLTSIVH